MKIVVVGGSGLIGSKLVATLARDGHEVVSASRRSGFDAVTGEGLAEGLRSASVVIDVSNSPSFEDAAVTKFFKTSTHSLRTAEVSARVQHQVAGVGCRYRPGRIQTSCPVELQMWNFPPSHCCGTIRPWPTMPSPRTMDSRRLREHARACLASPTECSAVWRRRRMSSRTPGRDGSRPIVA